MDRGNQTSARQIKMKRTRSWPYSPRGDRELRESEFAMVRVCVVRFCHGPSLLWSEMSWNHAVVGIVRIFWIYPSKSGYG